MTDEHLHISHKRRPYVTGSDLFQQTHTPKDEKAREDLLRLFGPGYPAVLGDFITSEKATAAVTMVINIIDAGPMRDDDGRIIDHGIWVEGGYRNQKRLPPRFIPWSDIHQFHPVENEDG